MSDLLGKLSSYNIINYIIPGGVFSYFLSILESNLINDNNILLLAFFVYFVGMLISRIGSIIIEPILRAVGYISFDSYNDYLSACEKDKKIDVLMESASLYRTMFTGFLLLFIFLFLKSALDGAGILSSFSVDRVWMSLLSTVLFLVSYRKQINYVRKRILYCREVAD